MDERTDIYRRYGLLLAVAVAYLSFTYTTLGGLWRIWMSVEEYSYAPVIPLVSAYVIWRKRQQIASAPATTYWPGLAALGLFWAVGLYGMLGSSPSAAQPAALLVMVSIVLFCYGRRQLRLLLFPLALLAFMLPLPTVVETGISIPLRSWSTRLGEILLRLAGVSVFVEGNIIDLGVTRLQVVDACSGLRYLLPLTALGVIYAYFREKTRWRQAVLVASTVPIAVISNAIRIAVTGYLAQRYGVDTSEGFYHGFSGWLIFVFAVLLLMLLHAVLSVRRADPSAEKPDKTHAPSAREDPGPNIRYFPDMSKGVAALTCALLLAGSLLTMTVAKRPPVRLATGISSFPLQFDRWRGKTETLDSRIIALSGAEEAFNAAYVSTSGEMVSLYMGYRGSPYTESVNFFHSPSVCMPSLGWRTIDLDAHTIGEIPGVGTITVRKMLIEKTGVRQLVYYWFQTTDRISANVHLNRLHLTLHALAGDRTYDLFLRPITPWRPQEPFSAAEARLDGFVRSLMAELGPFLSQRAPSGQ